MKRAIAILCAALLLIAVTIPSFAIFGSGKEKGSGNGNGQQTTVQTTLKDKKAAREEQKAKAKEFAGQYTEIRELRKTNIALTNQNKMLRNKLNAKLKAIKASKMSLPADALEKLKTLSAQIETDHSAIAVTKGDVQRGIKTSREQIRSGQYDAAAGTLGGIKSMISQRNAKLTSINTALNQMLTLIEGATLIPRTSPAPTAAPTPVPTATQSSL